MALSEKVKRQAAAVIAGNEMMEWIRERNIEKMQAAPSTKESTNVAQIKQRALDVVFQSSMMKQIRLVSVDTSGVPTKSTQLSQLYAFAGEAAKQSEHNGSEWEDGR